LFAQGGNHTAGRVTSRQRCRSGGAVVVLYWCLPLSCLGGIHAASARCLPAERSIVGCVRPAIVGMGEVMRGRVLCCAADCLHVALSGKDCNRICNVVSFVSKVVGSCIALCKPTSLKGVFPSWVLWCCELDCSRCVWLSYIEPVRFGSPRYLPTVVAVS
jgi:hypothetical protein